MILLPDDLNNEYAYQKDFKTNTTVKDLLFLFLDFDGVLHPLGSPIDFCEVKNFESVLRNHENVQVVFSTSWTDSHSFENLRNNFSVDLHPRFVGMTKDIPSNRGMACKQWLKENKFENKLWLALDDVAIFSFDDPVVRVNTLTGLQEDTITVLKEAIKNPKEFRAFVSLKEEIKELNKKDGYIPIKPRIKLSY